MKKLILALVLLMLSSLAWAAPDADHDADRGVADFPTLTSLSADDFILLSDTSNSNRFSKILQSNFRAAIGLGVNDNPSWLSVHASGGNLAAANAQVTKKWITGLPYVADVTSVIHGGHHFICTSNHTAGSTTEPGVGASWATVWKYSGEVIDASGFNGNLATTDDTLQEIAQKLDDLVAGGDDLGDATASNVVTLFNSGTCSGYLKSDGTCDTPSGAAHDAVTLDTETAAIFSLSTQQITLDSQTANYFLAAPNGSAGDPTFRAIADADIPSAIARDSELPTASSLSVDDLITLSGVAGGSVNLGAFTGATIDDDLTIKAALQDVETSFEAKLPAGTDGQYGVWLTNNTTNPTTYSTGKWGYTVYNNAPYWCYNGTCTAIPSAGFANPMTTAGDMIKGGTAGAATRMVPGTGVVTALEATPNATGGILTHGSAPLAGIVDSTTEALGAGSLEVGHASDTTIARSEAGVITVEGVVVPTTSSTSTLTNKTLDANGTGNVVKGYGYVTFTKPHNRGSATAAVGTTETDQLYGVPAFADDVETNNYVDYIAIVPPDWDSSVDPVATLKFRLGGSDTADHDYIVSMIDIADSTAAAGTPADAINLAYTADGSGASGDIETATATLTGWGSAASASAYWLIRVTRDGDDGTNDASTVDSYPMSLTIRYGFSQ